MRVIQVGAGGFGRSWAQLAMAAPGVELAALVDPAPAAVAWARSELGLGEGRTFASLEEALARVEAEAVLVVTPPPTHHAVVTAALAAGRHVLVEKPLATTLADALDLVRTAEHAGRTLMVSQNYRFRAPARAVQRAVEEGAVGRLTAVRIACRRDTRQLFGEGNFRYAMRHPFLLDMAIHHLDLLRALTGQDARRVFARSWPVPDSPYAHHPAMVAVLELAEGATVVYEGDWATHDPETSWNGDWEVVGETGRLLWRGGVADATVGEVTLERWDGTREAVEQPTLEHVDRAGTLQAFRAAVEGRAAPETSGADNVNSLAVVLGCVASVESGEAVDLPRLLAAAAAGAA